MAVYEKDGKRTYRSLLEQGIPREEIDRVYRKLREKGYGKEDTERRFREAVLRLRERRRQEERARRGRARTTESESEKAGTDAYPQETGRGKAAAETVDRKIGDSRGPGSGPPDDRKNRAADEPPRVSFRLRWMVNGWAYRRGLRITGLPERLADLLAFFFPGRGDFVSDELVRLLCLKDGFSIDQPLKNSLRDTLDTLTRSSRLFLGGGRGARTYLQREKAQKAEQEIRQAWARREPFGLSFLSRFAVSDERLECGLAYVELAWRNRQRVGIPDLDGITRGTYRLILGTEQVEYPRIVDILAVGRDINLAYDGSSGAHERLAEAERLFLQAYRHLQTFGTELYPALLKMIGRFYELDDESAEKTKRIHAFLGLGPEDILSYRSFREQLEKRKEEQQRRQEQGEVERLEKVKEAGFSERFGGILDLTDSLFPDAEFAQLEKMPYLLPYFDVRVFGEGGVVRDRSSRIETLSRHDPMGTIMVLHRILDDLLEALREEDLAALLEQEDFAVRVSDLRRHWQEVFPAVFDPYLSTLDRYARDMISSERYGTGFRSSRAARGMEEELNRLRNLAIREYGNTVMYREAKSGPKLYRMAEELHGLLMEAGAVLHMDLVNREDPISRRLLDDIRRRKLVDYSLYGTPGRTEYKPMIRQLRRYIEARYRNPVERVPEIAQLLYLELFRGLADLYQHLLNDEDSIVRSAVRDIVFASDEERSLWERERNERGRHSADSFRRRLRERLRAEYIDRLTGLKNRNYFQTELPARLRKRPADEKITLIMADIDHFKWINDRCGHPAGDEVLRDTARMILDSIRRDEDVAVRYGGEEIAILVPDALHAGIMLAERIRFAQEQNLRARDSLGVVRKIAEEKGVPCGTLSVGIAQRRAGEGLESLLQRADRALFEAKRERNRVVFCEKDPRGGERLTAYADYVERAGGSRDGGKPRPGRVGTVPGAAAVPGDSAGDLEASASAGGIEAGTAPPATSPSPDSLRADRHRG